MAAIGGLSALWIALLTVAFYQRIVSYHLNNNELVIQRSWSSVVISLSECESIHYQPHLLRETIRTFPFRGSPILHRGKIFLLGKESHEIMVLWSDKNKL